MLRITTLPKENTADEAIAVIEREGSVIVEDAVRGDLVQRLNEDLGPIARGFPGWCRWFARWRR